MNNSNLTAEEQTVLTVVKEKHLTSFEILKKVENLPNVLSLYNVIDKLKTKGKLDSYMKENVKYHYASN